MTCLVTSLETPAAEPLPADLAAQVALADDLLVMHPTRAEQVARSAVRLAEAQGEDVQAGRARVLLGGALFFQARYDEALLAFRQALSTARAHHDRVLEARALNGLGNVVSYQGDYAGALEHFMESSRVALDAGDEHGRVRVLNNIAAVWSELGEYGSALQHHQEVLRVAGQVGDASLVSSARVNVMVDHHALGEFSRALDLTEALVPALEAAGLRQHLVVAQAYRADSLLRLGRAEDAQRVILAALPLAEAIGEQAHTCFLLGTLAMTHQHQGQPALALPVLERAVALAREHRLAGQERDLLGRLSEVREALGDHRGALRDLRAHYALERQLHAEDVDRKTRFLTAQFQLDSLKREAELERQRARQLEEDHSALQEDHALLAHVAAHDALTGLANRAHFQAVAEQALARAGGACVGLLFLDLDGFKAVNDTLGHDAGDDLLRQVAGRLRSQVRRGDLVARPGGDEFTVLLPHLRTPGDARHIAEKLLGVLTEPFVVAGDTVSISASVGVAVSPQDGMELGVLQRRADEAMYRVKRSGRGAVQTSSA